MPSPHRSPAAAFPVVDLRPGAGPAEGAIRAAAEELGAFLVVGHGLDLALVAEWEAHVDRLLTQPRERKAELASPTGHPFRGWRQWPDDFGRLELERYMVHRYDDAAAARAAGVAEEHLGYYAHANVWPARDPALRGLTHRYLDEAVGLAERLLERFAGALGVPAGRLALPRPDTTNLTVNEYPTWTWPDDGDGAADGDDPKLLLLEHADGNVLTLLRQGGTYEGLQVQRRDGSWTTVPVVADAFLVLLGTSMVRLTNGRWSEGRHRVVAGGEQRRRSTAIFYSPAFDTLLEPIPELVDDEPPAFEPLTVWDVSQGFVDDYLRVFARPAQVEAWSTRTPYIADVVLGSR